MGFQSALYTHQIAVSSSPLFAVLHNSCTSMYSSNIFRSADCLICIHMTEGTHCHGLQSSRYCMATLLAHPFTLNSKVLESLGQLHCCFFMTSQGTVEYIFFVHLAGHSKAVLFPGAHDPWPPWPQIVLEVDTTKVHINNCHPIDQMRSYTRTSRPTSPHTSPHRRGMHSIQLRETCHQVRVPDQRLTLSSLGHSPCSAPSAPQGPCHIHTQLSELATVEFQLLPLPPPAIL